MIKLINIQIYSYTDVLNIADFNLTNNIKS